MSLKLECSVKPGLASDTVYFSKLAELHALKSKESDTPRVSSSNPETMENSSSRGGLSSIKINKQNSVSGPPAGGLQSVNPSPGGPQSVNPSPEVAKRPQKWSRGGGMQETAGNLVPSISSSQWAPAEIEGKAAQKTALAQFFSKIQAKSGDKTLMLLTVNVVGSTGPLRFLVDAKDPVSKVIELALKAYSREGRLPHLGANRKSFELFCVNSNFEALDPGKPVGSLGARQFLLHRKRCEDQEAIEEQNEQAASFPWKIWLNLMNTIVCSH